MGQEQFPGICQRHGIEARSKTILYFVYVSPDSSTAHRASLVEFPFQSTLVCLNGIGVPSGDNPRSNRPERRTALVAQELARYKVDIAAFSETRFCEQDQLEEVGAGYTFFGSGRHRTER
nr:unnamed protein product [Spirometra erinaceieuropaei]